MLRPSLSPDRGDVLERRVDEHATQLGLRRRAAAIRSASAGSSAAGFVVEDHPERPRAQLDGQLRVVQARQAADLHLWGRLRHAQR